MLKSQGLYSELKQRLVSVKSAKAPLLIGCSGLQGVGKTTLGNSLKQVFQECQFESVSLDDFYLPYEDRLKLNQELYPYRGPPGTHDVQMMLNCFQEFKKGNPIEVPVFDKGLRNGHGDRVGFRKIKAEILFFEGWMVGYERVEESVIRESSLKLPNKRAFNLELALHMNNLLKLYQPLWECLDIRVCVIPKELELPLQWRVEAEQELRRRGGTGMSDAQVVEFVCYFWNCLHPALYGMRSDLVVEVDSERNLKLV